MQSTSPVTKTADSILTTNRVLRNTYALLSITLLFSAVMAAISMAIAPPRMVAMVCTFGALGVMWFLLPKFENSSAGIAVVFLFTGLLGFGLGPMLNHYVGLPGGASIVATAMGGTGVIFLGLSAYVLTTKKSFDFMGGMLMVGLIVVIGAAVLNIFLNIPALSMAVSGGIILLMSGFILFDTGRIINGGETNYIRATTSMFLSIFNLFTSLLHILGIMSDD
ncbi:Bax inhibitor-1/YccA family protein [Granulosicoccus sp.]|nr:Bax inhibitor-1/YccA family protein [Granulosicoccus sp.]MDB4224562.1 Bax inhibitor-1/YccA family protein [Granulosicoccus sp.]